MLLPQSVAKLLAVVAGLSIINLQCAALAAQSGASAERIEVSAPVETTSVTAPNKPILIASTCASCGAAELNAAVAQVGTTTAKPKSTSVLTDSLWGNLILELAYERDPLLKKYTKSVRRMNLGTTASVLGIAGGTLAQGISALYVLNPPSGVPDSYAPLNVGVALSGATILVMAARLIVGHHLAKKIEQRQIEVRDKVEAILAHVEYSHADCLVARNKLKELIGERATNEWMQLWRSSHKLANTNGHPTVSSSSAPQMSDLQAKLTDAEAKSADLQKKLAAREAQIEELKKQLSGGVLGPQAKTAVDSSNKVAEVVHE